MYVRTYLHTHVRTYIHMYIMKFVTTFCPTKIFCYVDKGLYFLSSVSQVVHTAIQLRYSTIFQAGNFHESMKFLHLKCLHKEHSSLCTFNNHEKHKFPLVKLD